MESLIDMNELKSSSVKRASSDASLLFEWISRIVRAYRLREIVPVDALTQTATSMFVHYHAIVFYVMLIDLCFSQSGEKVPQKEEGPTASAEANFLAAQAAFDKFDPFGRLLQRFTSRLRRLIASSEQLRKDKQQLQIFISRYRSFIATLEQTATSWQSELRAPENDSTLLLANCLLSAAFISYAGAMSNCSRELAKSAFSQICHSTLLSDSSLNTELPLVFGNITVGNFVMSEKDAEYISLPYADLQFSADNISLITGAHRGTWPLIFDPYKLAVSWIQFVEAGKDLLVISHTRKDFAELFKDALRNSRPVLVTDAESTRLWTDLSLHRFLERDSARKPGAVPTIQIGHEEIPLPDDIRVYFVYDGEATVPLNLEQHVTVIRAVPTKDDIEKRLHQFAASVSLPEVFNRQRQLVALIPGRRAAAAGLEGSIIENFAILSDHANAEQVGSTMELTIIDKVLDAHSAYDEVLRGLKPFVDESAHISKNMNEYANAIAQFSSGIYSVVIELAQLRSAYQYLRPSFRIYDELVQDASRKSIESIQSDQFISVFLKKLFAWIYPSLYSADRVAFATMIAARVGLDRAVLSPDMLTWINNALWSRINTKFMEKSKGPKRALRPRQSYSSISTTRTIISGKSEADLDAITPEFSLLFSASNVANPWLRQLDEINEELNRFKPDLMAWRDNKSNDEPPIPTFVYDSLSPGQLFIIKTTLRPDRIVSAAKQLTAAILPELETSNFFESAGDINPVEGTAASHPIVLICQKELNHCCLVSLLSGWAAEQKVTLESFVPSEGVNVVEALKAKVSEPVWLLLPRSLSMPVRQHVAHALAHTGGSFNPLFRLILSTSNDEELPTDLIVASSVRIMEVSTGAFKQTLLRCFTNVPNSMVEKYRLRNDWLPLLHNTCLIDRFEIKSLIYET